ncbi:DUF6037 family protein [Ralstonia pseudosolanacearum]
MQLNQLALLHKDMQARNLERIRFNYPHGRVSFDVFFFIDESPFLLLFGARGYNLVFEVEVKPGFDIDPYLDSADYKALCEALDLKFDPNNPFSPKAFFADFAKHIPATVPINCAVNPQDLVQFRRNVEEADKVYFCGWHNNATRGENVTEKNLHKTRELLGKKAYQACKRKNISSCWTDDQTKATAITVP